MEIILLLVACLIAWIVFTLLVKVVKASVKTALLIAFGLVVVQVVFGIGPGQVWQQIANLFQSILNL
ncbi:MAG: hypothetical protein ACPGVO_22130, partial [Spirulinaceae cyanobacterium]